MISFEDILVITQIYEDKNFSQAAEHLFLGQSTLSRKVKKIEDELGYTIFIRSRGDRKITLTEKGKLLIPMIYNMKSIYKYICDIKYTNERKPLRIASTDGPFFLAIDSVVEKLLSCDGNYSFKLYTSNFNECIDALTRDQVDIAFVGKLVHIKNMDFIPLYKEDICLVAKEGYFDKKTISLRELNPLNSVISPFSEDLMNWFNNTFDQRQPLIQCDLNSELERFILSQDLWSFVPTSLAKDFEKNGICVYPVSEPLPKRVIYYATQSHNRDFIVSELLKEIKTELLKFRHITVY